MLNVLAGYPPCHYVGFAGIVFLVTVIGLIGVGAGFTVSHHTLTKPESKLASGLTSLGLALIAGDLWWNGAFRVADLLSYSKMPVLTTGFILIVASALLLCYGLYKFFHKANC